MNQKETRRDIVDAAERLGIRAITRPYSGDKFALVALDGKFTEKHRDKLWEQFPMYEVIKPKVASRHAEKELYFLPLIPAIHIP